MPALMHCSIYSSTTLGISLGEKAWRSMESSMGTTIGSLKGESDRRESERLSKWSFLLWLTRSSAEIQTLNFRVVEKFAPCPGEAVLSQLQDIAPV